MVSVNAQIILSTHSLSYVQRFQFAGSPYPQPIQITGTGTVQVSSFTGTPFNFQSAFLAPICQTLGTSQCIRTTSVPATLWGAWNGYGNNALSPGTYTGILNLVSTTGCVGGCSITITLQVISYPPPPFNPAIPVGCNNSSVMYSDLDTCTPVIVPGTITPIAIGLTWNSEFFGTKITAMSNPSTGIGRTLPSDTTVSTINADNSLVMVGGSTGIFANNTTTGAQVWSGIPLGDGTNLTCWDANDPLSYYYNKAVTIHKVTLVTPPSTFTDNVIYTYPGMAASITGSADNECSKDNWMALFTLGPGGSWTTGNDQAIIVLNLSNPTQVYTRIVTSDVSAGFIPRLIYISPGINQPDGNRYIMLQAGGSPTGGGTVGGASHTGTHAIYTFKGTTISFAYNFPQKPDAQRSPTPTYGIPCDNYAAVTGQTCYTTNHSALIESNGIEYFAEDAGVPNPFFIGSMIHRLDVGPNNVGVSFEAGGGNLMPFYITSFAGSNAGDLHMGASRRRPFLVVSQDGQNVLTAYRVTNLTIGVNPTVTSSPNYAGINGDKIAFGAGLNGLTNCIVANLSGATFTAQGCTSTGTYAGNRGAFTKMLAPVAGPHMDEIDIVDISNISSGKFKVQRLASSRSHSFNGGYADNVYFGQPHAVISQDASLVCWQFNNYLPDNLGVACASTGIAPIAPTLTCPTSSGVVGVSYSSSFTAIGGTIPYTFSIVSGTLPLGLSLSSGTISGIPTTPQTQSFTAQVTDKNGLNSSSPCTITISSMTPPPPNPSISCPTTTTGTTGQIFSSGFLASSGSPSYSFSITVGSLPTGLVLNSSTGGISGTPSLAGTYNFTGKVMDSNSNSATVPCSITIASPAPPPPPLISCPATTSGIVGSPYSSNFIGSNGVPPYTFSIISGTLPVGLSLIGPLISGVPTATGNYNFTGKISDTNSLMGTVPCTISISTAPPAPQPAANLIGVYSTQNFFAGVYSTLISLVGSI